MTPENIRWTTLFSTWSGRMVGQGIRPIHDLLWWSFVIVSPKTIRTLSMDDSILRPGAGGWSHKASDPSMTFCGPDLGYEKTCMHSACRPYGRAADGRKVAWSDCRWHGWTTQVWLGTIGRLTKRENKCDMLFLKLLFRKSLNALYTTVPSCLLQPLHGSPPADKSSEVLQHRSWPPTVPSESA